MFIDVRGEEARKINSATGGIIDKQLARLWRGIEQEDTMGNLPSPCNLTSENAGDISGVDVGSSGRGALEAERHALTAYQGRLCVKRKIASMTALSSYQGSDGIEPCT